MKKVLLSVFAMGLAFAANSQCANGFFLYSAADDFNQVNQYNKVYWWTQTAPAPVDTFDGRDPVAGCTQGTANFAYTSQRLGNGKLTYTITQPYGKYEPIGVGFGDGDSLDLSGGNAQVNIGFKNLYSADVHFSVALQDVKGVVLNAKGNNGGTGNQYLDDVFTYTVAAGGTFSQKVDFTTGTYASSYTLDPLNCEASTPNPADNSFDFTKVKAVVFTITTVANAGGADGYKPLGYQNAQFEISKFEVGGCVTGISDGILSSSSGFAVYPNPATGDKVSFTKAENVKVMDSMGKVVFSAPSASEVSISSFTKGVYVIQTSKGTSRFIVQ